MIEEADWLTLVDDLKERLPGGPEGYDAVICLGNSFPHLPDSDGQKLALGNFYEIVKPGGVLIIDHRNYDHLLDTGNVPVKNAYYNVRLNSSHTSYNKCC